MAGKICDILTMNFLSSKHIRPCTCKRGIQTFKTTSEAVSSREYYIIVRNYNNQEHIQHYKNSQSLYALAHQLCDSFRQYNMHTAFSGSQFCNFCHVLSCYKIITTTVLRALFSALVKGKIIYTIPKKITYLVCYNSLVDHLWFNLLKLRTHTEKRSSQNQMLSC